MKNENIKILNEVLNNMFLAAIGDNYKKSFISNIVERFDQTFIQIFKIFLNKYGKLGLLDLKKNKERIKTAWDPGFPYQNSVLPNKRYSMKRCTC